MYLSPVRGVGCFGVGNGHENGGLHVTFLTPIKKTHKLLQKMRMFESIPDKSNLGETITLHHTTVKIK